MSESQVHEEKWELSELVETNDDGMRRTRRAVRTPHGAITFATPVDDDVAAVDELTLAAAAPEMARLLVELRDTLKPGDPAYDALGYKFADRVAVLLKKAGIE